MRREEGTDWTALSTMLLIAASRHSGPVTIPFSASELYRLRRTYVLGDRRMAISRGPRFN